MFEYSPEIRRLIYTTNAIEGFNNGVKRITKTKSSFPSDETLFKLHVPCIAGYYPKMDYARSKLEFDFKSIFDIF